jgi:hypothetical protein
MSKAAKRSLRASPPDTKKTSTTDRHPLKKLLTRGAAFVIAVVGILGVAVEVWPRVHAMPPDETADPFHPYEVSFSLQNTGNLPIYAVDVQCFPHQITFWSRRAMKQGPSADEGDRRFVANEIASGKSRPFTCDVFKWEQDSPGAHDALPATYAELGVQIRFRPIRFIPLNWSVFTQVFATVRQTDGRLQWREYNPPLESADPKYPAD